MVLYPTTKNEGISRISTGRHVGLALLVVCASINSSTASILEKKFGFRKIERVLLASEVIFRSEDRPITLLPYVAGLLRKKVMLFPAKVYVGQIFAPPGLSVPPISIDKARADLIKQPVIAITMSFVRDVDLKRLRTGFEDTLRTNGIEPQSDDMEPLFSILTRGGGVKDGQEITIVLERRANGAEWVYYENGKTEVQSSGIAVGAIPKILTIWLGKPAHAGMESMQREFLGGRP
jgi:hypothetical protein